ncbi:hypothetical protein DAPPUDRAFT_333233 [Daphnia pulex]|uniref:Uncharacterized protein n=1 Tax=Daphnia pulex TaxID=6669 RepID=E9HSA0_DAPPU|nr:hypothetical protein DAPPUDRAFT_333233 [Daphnia pulex]|eukprot:EFX65382.1 hypothetical protein DAPPUDRAFT_333233 [Daphnia pulex]
MGLSNTKVKQHHLGALEKIKAFLREQTGLVYEIHIIQESAARGSILSTDETQVNHDRAAPGEDDLHFPLAYVSSLFVYHFAANWKVGYMMKCPGDYNGKIANYVANMKKLRKQELIHRLSFS